MRSTKKTSTKAVVPPLELEPLFLDLDFQSPGAFFDALLHMSPVCLKKIVINSILASQHKWSIFIQLLSLLDKIDWSMLRLEDCYRGPNSDLFYLFSFSYLMHNANLITDEDFFASKDRFFPLRAYFELFKPSNTYFPTFQKEGKPRPYHHSDRDTFLLEFSQFCEQIRLDKVEFVRKEASLPSFTSTTGHLIACVSALYGSFQCFKFCLLNNFALPPIWYAVAGGNQEITQLLLERDFVIERKVYHQSILHHRNLMTDSLLTKFPEIASEWDFAVFAVIYGNRYVLRKSKVIIPINHSIALPNPIYPNRAITFDSQSLFEWGSTIWEDSSPKMQTHFVNQVFYLSHFRLCYYFMKRGGILLPEHDRISLPHIVFLTQVNYDINRKDHANLTLLHSAILCSQIDSISFLLEHGAKLMISHSDGRTTKKLVDSSSPKVQKAFRGYFK